MGDRFRAVVPMLALVGLGLAMVLVGMNVLAVVAPIAIGGGETPSPAASGPSFAAIPSYDIVTEAPVESIFPTASLPPTVPTILTKHIDESDPDGVWAVSIAYPAFLGSSTPWASEMNDQIETIVRSAADKYEQGPAAVRTHAGTNHLAGDFTTDLVTSALASFTLTWNDDQTPGQIAVTIATLNFDLSTGQPIAFDDMFADPDTALQILSTQSADLLYYQLGAAWDQDQGTLGTSPNYGNFVNWTITKSGLKVVFNQYQVLRTGQTPSVVVTWSALIPVLAGSGPVADISGASAAANATPSASSSPTAGSTSPGGPSPTPTPES